MLSSPEYSRFELPSYLAERVRLIQEGKPSGELVVYWMQTAMRCDENPALEVASHLARELDLPLLVFQRLGADEQFASDRHHQFVLEGVRDVQEQFDQLGITYAFQLDRQGESPIDSSEWIKRAAVIITEDLPVDPYRQLPRSLTGQVPGTVLAVDTSCVVPMRTVGKSFTRAYAFRDALEKDYAQRVGQTWPDVNVSVRNCELADLELTPLDLRRERIPDLIARCDIDHLVPPTRDVGGSAAGYRRWNDFLGRGIRGYARKRNDPLLEGTSRMSPYLHYGMVSPFRIAREAAAVSGGGAEKYLDELLIWRELAHNLCFHREDHGQWSVLPTWARETLESHRTDLRSVTYTWEELARARTDDDFWNACQESLLRFGELHNNVRMTWGKAVPQWTADPRRALELLIDLNHRYALDGRDPSSYGGLLWCLGLFDRPFTPERKIMGSVRWRSTHEHAQRLDPGRLRQQLRNLHRPPQAHVAVIGAGLSGLTAARALQDHGVQVTVFEKSRGSGGRMATRRTDHGAFDHGAQYFTVRDQCFGRHVEAWREQGLVQEWPVDERDPQQRIVSLREGEILSESNSVQRFVAVPAMNSICKHLAREVSVRTEHRIESVKKVDGQLILLNDEGKSWGPFDGVVVSAPAEQSSELLRDWPELSESLAGIKMLPCWACMASFASPLTDQWAGAFLQESFLRWTSRNATKPGREIDHENLVIHAGPEWTSEHWEEPPEQVAEEMLREFWRVTGLPDQRPIRMTAHRWKYALAESDRDDQCFFDEDTRIAVCGDWACGSRVEGAFLSGTAAFGRLYRALMAREPVALPEPSLFD